MLVCSCLSFVCSCVLTRLCVVHDVVVVFCVVFCVFEYCVLCLMMCLLFV